MNGPYVENWLDLRAYVGNTQCKIRDLVCQLLIFMFDL